MDARRLVILVVVLAGGWWYWSHRQRPASAPASPGASSSAASNGQSCVDAAEAANRKLHDAAMLLNKPPVDAGAWSSAQGDVSSAISSAESACTSPATDADRKAADEVKGALGLMRSTLSALDGAARGQGGAGAAVQNQEEIDAHLDRARGYLRG